MVGRQERASFKQITSGSLSLNTKRKVNGMKRTSSTIAISALALMLGLTTAFAGKAYPPPEVLSGHWWQWALSIPAAINPVADATGEFAAVGQSGPVWYLAGNFGGTTERTITVPAEKALFFPILNYFAGGFLHPGDYPPGPIEYARELCKEAIDQATGMSCKVDGVTIPITAENRVQSDPCAVHLPADNLLQPAPATIPAMVADGYYALLEPLAAGTHTVHFAGTLGTFSLDVTYNITVE
jgi:hypothetical protein